MQDRAERFKLSDMRMQIGRLREDDSRKTDGRADVDDKKGGRMGVASSQRYVRYSLGQFDDPAAIDTRKKKTRVWSLRGEQHEIVLGAREGLNQSVHRGGGRKKEKEVWTFGKTNVDLFAERIASTCGVSVGSILRSIEDVHAAVDAAGRVHPEIPADVLHSVVLVNTFGVGPHGCPTLPVAVCESGACYMLPGDAARLCGDTYLRLGSIIRTCSARFVGVNRPRGVRDADSFAYYLPPDRVAEGTVARTIADALLAIEPMVSKTGTRAFRTGNGGLIGLPAIIEAVTVSRIHEEDSGKTKTHKE
jgi:hypothetical protein